MTTHRLSAYGLVLTLAALSLWTSQASAQVAVIVHSGNSAVEDLSLQELRRIYLGQVTTFPDGTRITLLQTQGWDTTFYRSVLDRSVHQVQKHWIGVLLSGGAGTPPETVSVEESLDMVSRDRGAICFVPGPIDGSVAVKVLNIGGFSPSDDGYPIRQGVGR